MITSGSHTSPHRPPTLLRLTTALLICAAAALMMPSCSGDTNTTGVSLLSEQDRIIVGCDTFVTTTRIVEAIDIFTSPDSFLLGECDSRFGTLHADILAQFTCPVGFVFPDNAEVDSVCLFFYYTSWFGDGSSPLSISVYQIDKQAIDYNVPYSHNIDVAEYCTLSEDNMVVSRQRIIVPAVPSDSTYNSATSSYIPFVRMRLKDSFAQQVFAQSDYSSLDTFTRNFKGLYLQSDFGSANLLHVNGINLALYYHFSYDHAGTDTVVNDVKGYYANAEVRQINRYVYLNEDIDGLRKDSDSVCYVVSPANMYTRVSLPIRSMAEQIMKKMSYAAQTGDTLYKRPYINKAELDIRVLNHYDGYSRKTRDDWAQPAENMLLIKESAVDRFFSKNEVPSDTCAILATLSAKDSGGEVPDYFYVYDIATLLTNAIRQIEAEKSDTAATRMNDNLDMLLVPVTVGSTTSSSSYYSYTTTSSSVTSVKHEQTVSATVIQSASNQDDPLDLEVVFSGF